MDKVCSYVSPHVLDLLVVVVVDAVHDGGGAGQHEAAPPLVQEPGVGPGAGRPPQPGDHGGHGGDQLPAPHHLQQFCIPGSCNWSCKRTIGEVFIITEKAFSWLKDTMLNGHLNMVSRHEIGMGC